MKNLLVAIVSEGLFSLVALLVISAIVWFGGDYLGYPVKLRIVVILVVLAVWLVLYLVQRILAVRRAMRIEAMLRAQTGAATVSAAHGGPVEAMTHQFRLGVQALRGTRAGKAAVLSTPWFLILGPPGSGKTAAVRESGLNFPWIGLGHRANPAAGSTRAIDWWFAEQAVFLDTAGAYVAEPARHKEWLALVRLLARTGRARPIDGVVLVVSIAELLALGDDRINDHAQRLRDRIDELAARLGMTFPIHLVFSHCDQLHGFCDFFAHLPVEERSQAWGTTIDWNEAGPQGLQARVEQECQRLYQVLGQRRLESLAAANAGEAGGDRQRNALLFPIQFALLQRRIGHYIAALTRPNPFQESGRLRGFYFASAAQGGEPVDRVMASIGLGGGTLPPVAVGEQRAYFLNAPFATIIPGDIGLARTSRRVVRRHGLVAALLAVVAVGAAAGAGYVLYLGYARTESLLAGLADDGRRLRDTSTTTSDGTQVADDLSDRLQRFDRRDGIPYVLYPGLMFTGDLVKQAHLGYVKHAARPLVESCARRVAAELAVRLAAKERSLEGYEQIAARFRVYLMLCGRMPIELDAVLAGVADPSHDAAAAAHLRYTLTSFPSQDWVASLDATLDEQVRHELRDALWIPLTSVEIAHAGATLYPPTDLAALLNGRATSAFTLSETVPGFFSPGAWDGFVAHAIEERAQALAKRFAEIRIDLDAAAIAQRLRDRYAESYANAWRGLPSHLHITPPRDLAEATALLGELGHEGSPYRALVLAWLNGKSLSTAAPGAQAVAAIGAAAQGGKGEAKDAKPAAWLDQALNAVGILHAALAQYAIACPPGARLGDLGALDKAVAACAACDVAAGTALAAYPEAGSRQAFLGNFRALAEGARVALEREPLLEAAVVSPGLHMAISRADLERRLQSVGVPGFPRLWRAVLAALVAPPTADAASASTRLANLAQPRSPLAQLLRAAWRGQKLDAQGAAASADPAWIDRSLGALGALAAAYAPAVAAEPGPRLAREDALKRVAAAFADAERDLGAAQATISDLELRSLVARPFAQILGDAEHRLRALLATDADQLWEERVRQRFASELASAFPFRDVPQDADAKLVVAFLAPRTGAVWEAERLLAGAAAISLGGQPLVRFDPGYERSLAGVRALRDALFAGGDETAPVIVFSGALRQRAGVFQEIVEVGKQHLDLNDNPAARTTFTCALADPVACRLAVQVADGSWLEVGSEPRPWGILRWAGSGRPVVVGGMVVLTWSLPEAASPAGGAEVDGLAKPPAAKPVLGQFAIDAGPASGLLTRRLFDELVFPATIAVRPTE